MKDRTDKRSNVFGSLKTPRPVGEQIFWTLAPKTADELLAEYGDMHMAADKTGRKITPEIFEEIKKGNTLCLDRFLAINIVSARDGRRMMKSLALALKNAAIRGVLSVDDLLNTDPRTLVRQGRSSADGEETEENDDPSQDPVTRLQSHFAGPSAKTEG